jgi:hypothetical protein
MLHVLVTWRIIYIEFVYNKVMKLIVLCVVSVISFLHKKLHQ